MEAVRRLAFTGALSIFEAGSFVQLFLGMWLCIIMSSACKFAHISLLLSTLMSLSCPCVFPDMTCKPFVNSSDEYLAIGTQLQVYLVLMCSILIQLTDESATSSGVVSALLITSFVAVVTLGVVLAVLQMVSEAQTEGFEGRQLWSRVRSSVRDLSTGRRSVEIEMRSARSGPEEGQENGRQSASGGVRATQIFDMDELQENDEVVHVQNPLNI